MTPERYIQVILPLRLEWEPCYYLSDGQLAIGDRVQVIFAGRKQIGVVSAIDVHPDLPKEKIHPVLSIETGLEKVSDKEIELWRFMAEYYLCTIGEIYKASYPASKTGSEEVKVRAVKRKEALEEKTIELWKSRVEKLRRQLSAKDEALRRKHKESVSQTLMAQRAKIAQDLQTAQERLASLSRTLGNEERDYSALLNGLNGLKAETPERSLSSAFAKGRPVLLVSSDRYRSYISLAADSLRKGRNVLVLVNESALAETLKAELESSFGEFLLVHLSAMTAARKRDISEQLRAGRPYILIGTRSSIFLPHQDLGLIIVDNEQSAFYKQSDSAPRYNARDCAVKLAMIHGAKVLLGTGSPSLESRLNAMNGRYVLLSEEGRMEHGHPGRFTLIDIAAEKRKNGMLGPFSRKLINEAESVLRLQAESRIALIRGFEKETELKAASEAVPSLAKAEIFTIPEASRTDFSAYSLVAMLSADAMFDSADFRSDERAFQFLDSLRSMCRNVLVQTAQSKNQVYNLKDSTPLLAERAQFNLPPYTRLVDIRIPFPGKTSPMVEEIYRKLLKEGIDAAYPLVYGGYSDIRVTMKRDSSLQAKKKKLRSIVEDCRSKFRFNGSIILDADPV